MTDCDVWKLLAEDDFYRQFLDKKAGTEVKIQIGPQCLSVADQIKKLADGIALLDKELQTQVLSNYENLLSQATWVEKLEGVLAMMHSHTQTLLSGVERLRTKVVEPYEKIEMQTAMLGRLHTTSDLLRRVSRIQHLMKRLNVQMQADSIDIVKVAQSLCELAHLCEDVDLSGLEVLEEDQRRMRSYRHDVERQAKSLLHEGLQTRNVSSILTAVQVFHNLGSLEQPVKIVVDGAKEKIVNRVKESLDVSVLTQMHSIGEANKTRGAPGRAAMPSPGNTSNFRSRLWTSLEGVFEVLYASCCQVDLLHRVLRKKVRDSSILHQRRHNVTYLELLPEEHRQLSEKFWKEVTTLLAEHIAQIAQSSTFIKQALEGEYPKFLRLYLDVCKRLEADTCNDEKETSYSSIYKIESIQSSPFTINREVVNFENAYLSRSVSRLLDPVHLMFSSESMPSQEDVDALIRTMTSELSVSLVDVSLSRTVAHNIGKAIRLFCLKCEHLVVTSGEATQVIELPTAGQVTNVTLANLLYYLNTQIVRVVSNMKSSLPQESSNVLLESLNNVEVLTTGILSPILHSVADAIEAIIITMHNEDYSFEASPGGSTSVSITNKKSESQQCSLYMRELQSFIARAANNYLSPFNNQEIVSKCSIHVAKKTIDLFLHNVSVVRPLGEGGRVRLSADFLQLESALSPLCKQLSDLGRVYRTLRSFRSFLFLTPEEMADSPVLGEVVPYSLTLLMLFSRGPTELLSPHQSANWSVSRFCSWLENHQSERERLEFISGALQRYQQNVRQRGETSFHSVYPIMVSILEKGVEKST